MPLLEKSNSEPQYSVTPEVLNPAGDKKRSKNVSAARSKNVARVRRSPAKDTRILKRISAFQVPSSGVSSSVVLPTPLHTAQDLPLYAPSSDIPARSPIPVWAHTGDKVKAVFATAALLITERPAVAFTFNLTEQAIERAKSHPAGFLDSLKRSFDAELKKAFGAVFPYWFAIDLSDGGRLHIHGAFLSPSISIRTVRKIRTVMKDSWGHWDGPGKRMQVRFRKLYSDDWATYSIRNRRKVEDRIGPRTLTVTQPLTRDANWVYDEVRRIMRPELLKMQPEG